MGKNEKKGLALGKVVQWHQIQIWGKLPIWLRMDHQMDQMDPGSGHRATWKCVVCTYPSVQGPREQDKFRVRKTFVIPFFFFFS